jgi:nitric oxide reductase NorQ protein
MTASAIPAPAPKGRLGNGQLRRQVAEWLAARPGPHTVGEIAKDLGRSAGAVGNALTTLADRAEAARITGKPLRYEANSATRRRSRRHHPQGTLTDQVLRTSQRP